MYSMSQSLTKLSANAKVAVVGAGVSGLTFTYFLSKLRPDIKISLIDSSNRCGGYINSCNTKDNEGKPIMVEKGPRTLRGVSDGTVMIVDLLRSLHKEDTIQYIDSKSEANRKFLLDPSNKLIQVPNSPMSLLQFLLNPLGKGLISGLLGEPFRKAKDNLGADETAHSLICRRFGNEYVSNNVFSAIFHGIYSGDIKQLSAKRTLGALLEMEKEHGSFIKAMINKSKESYKKKKNHDTMQKHVLSDFLTKYQQTMGKDKEEMIELSTKLKKYPMLGLKNGLETFPKTLSEAVTGMPNVELLTAKDVSKFHKDDDGQITLVTSCGESLKGFQHLRLTNNPAIIGAMVEDPKLANELETVKSSTVLLVNFYLPKKDVLKQYHGFGYLVPQSNKNQEKLLGVIFDSVIEKNFQPLFGQSTIKSDHEYTKLTAMLGGHFLQDGSTDSIPSKSLIIRAVKHALQDHLDIDENDLNKAHWEVTVAKDCLPQFKVGYDEWLKRVEERFAQLYKDEVSLGGMAFSKGPGVPDVVCNGFEDALKLA